MVQEGSIDDLALRKPQERFRQAGIANARQSRIRQQRHGSDKGHFGSSDQSPIAIEATESRQVVFDILHGLLAHVEDRAVSVLAHDVLVQGALASLAVCPESGMHRFSRGREGELERGTAESVLGGLLVILKGAVAYVLLVQLGRLALVSAILADGRVCGPPIWALGRSDPSLRDSGALTAAFRHVVERSTTP